MEFVHQNKAKNTVKKTCSDINAWIRWCATVGELRPLDEIPTSEINSLLGYFAMKVRKQNGEEYEPDSITAFFRSFDRYMKDKGQTRSILLDIRQSGIVRPSASLLSLFTPWARLWNSAVKDQCRFAMWHYIIIRRGCSCRCGLGAEKSFSFLRERVAPRLHTFLVDEVRETVLIVDRYV